MTISSGDKLPGATLFIMSDEGPKAISTEDYFSGRKVALFAIPGAFTPTCAAQHIPSYLANLAALKDKGVDTVACIAVNDPFIMQAQAEAAGAAGRIDFLSDGNGEFTRAIGLELDGSGIGLGTRSTRYAMLVDDGVVRAIFVEPDPGQMTISSAENLLQNL